ncbi:hypothetical protein DPMN_000910 [Dreissena polymorpha]|uniref:Uncharacterized protein n=1 Tax=Dreissena polymorpha TaxID=45954 RepID=A0A9D4MJ67_DREPO|nr:hypothetical protein DPMN_000910 [Dreissena polymorpha]
MRDEAAEIFLQSGLLCADESNSFMGRDVHFFSMSIQLVSCRLRCRPPLACPGEQSCTESRA